MRLPLLLVPNNQVIPIMSGINRGSRWVTGTGPNRACWLGSYEADHLAALPSIIKSGMVAYDVGANAGFYTLALSRMVGKTGHVFAFEPEAKNAQALRRHIELNKLENVTIVQVAISGGTGMVAFDASGSAKGRIVDAGNYIVPSISLDKFIAEGNPAPDFIKMDIEGAEMNALSGAQVLFSNNRPTICLATHSDELRDGCSGLLRSHRYRLTALDGVNNPKVGDFLAFPDD
jgi:FkbM family methyltransferase